MFCGWEEDFELVGTELVEFCGREEDAEVGTKMEVPGLSDKGRAEDWVERVCLELGDGVGNTGLTTGRRGARWALPKNRNVLNAKPNKMNLFM